MLILYGGTRFIWEFFADNEKILFGKISELAIWAFASVVIGVIWFAFVLLKPQKAEALPEDTPEPMEESAD